MINAPKLAAIAAPLLGEGYLLVSSNSRAAEIVQIFKTQAADLVMRELASAAAVLLERTY